MDNYPCSVIVYSLSDHEVHVHICSTILPERYDSENIAGVSHWTFG